MARSERFERAANFGYVKAEYDRMLEGRKSHVVNSNEFTALHNEKEGLRQRVAQLTQELEKGKVYTDQSLDRAAVSNARLLEEKERLEKAYGFYLPDVVDEIQKKSKDQGFDIMSDSEFDAQFYNQ